MGVNILKSPQKVNTTPSFGSTLAPVEKVAKKTAKKIAEKIIRDTNKESYRSGTYLKDVQFGSRNFKDHISRALAMLKIAENQAIIFTYRIVFGKLKFKNIEECEEVLKKVISKVRTLNCGECGFIAHKELSKKGISSRVVYDPNIDHCFAIVNRSEPFTSYKDAKKGEFVIDLWTKKLYNSVEEAYVEFKTKFDANISTKLEDRTETNPYKFFNVQKQILTDTNSPDSNKTILEKMFDSINKIKKLSAYLAQDIRKNPQKVEHKLNGRLINEYLDDMSSYIRDMALQLNKIGK